MPETASLKDALRKDATPKDATPKDAAAVILWRRAAGDEREVFWARRSERLAFLGGFHAFPGGQREQTDAQADVRISTLPATDAHVESAESEDCRVMIACAARELFEELGVLVARGAQTLTVGQRASLLDDLESGRATFPDLLAHFGLHLDAGDFTFVGRWVTPPFSPRRFDTWFFLVECPAKQTVQLKADAELEDGEWLAASAAVERWQESGVLLAPPVLHALRTLAVGWTDDLVARFLNVPQAQRGAIRRIEFMPGLICFPLRTPTKPPATHTNCFILGGSNLVVIDPSSPDREEQSALEECLDELANEGRLVREIILTHNHPDHIGGVESLRAYLENATHYAGAQIPVAAHRLTADLLRDAEPFPVRVDHYFADGDELTLAGTTESDPPFVWRVLHTPGHAPGHLCFYNEQSGALIAGDMVVGIGSILIDTADGDMSEYIKQLERLRALPNLRALFGAHGPPSGAARQKIDEYINHRLERERNILNAVRDGAGSIKEIVARVYTDVSPKAHPMAERAVQAHLKKLIDEKKVEETTKGFVGVEV